MDRNKYIRENYLTMSDSEMGKVIGCSKDALRHYRKKLGLKRDNIFDDVLTKHNIDSNWNHGWLKDDKTSIFIRNENGLMTYEEIRDELIEEVKKYAPTYKKITYPKIKDGHLLVVDPADIHVGKLGLLEETNGVYNMDIARTRVKEGVNGIIQKSLGFNIEKILLVIGNDIIHIDHPHRTSTAGTPQDTDGQWWQMFQVAKSLYIEIIEELEQIAPLHIVFNPSNHDYASGYMLADTISSWFSKNKNITFDVSIIHRKYFEWGTNLICTSHGDGAKEADMPLLMASEAPQKWANTKFRYIYLHHIHHKKQLKWQSGKDYQGATVEYLRSPSGTDGWHDRNGYVAVPKAIEGFIHSKENGQVARLTHYF